MRGQHGKGRRYFGAMFRAHRQAEKARRRLKISFDLFMLTHADRCYRTLDPPATGTTLSGQLELHTACQRTVHDEIGSGDEARRRAKNAAARAPSSGLPMRPVGFKASDSANNCGFSRSMVAQTPPGKKVLPER